MRCRKLSDYTDKEGVSHRNVVWFGSGGVISENEASLIYIKVNSSDAASNEYVRIDGFYKIHEENETYTYKKTVQTTNEELYEYLIIHKINYVATYIKSDGVTIDFNFDRSLGNDGYDYLNNYIYIKGTSSSSEIDINEHELELDSDDFIDNAHSLHILSNVVTVSDNTLNLNSSTSEDTYSGYIQITNTKIPIEDEGETNINYSENQKCVRDNLIQRLSVFKKELWYRADYGLPLFEKIRDKGIIDAIVIDIITSTPGVANLISYSSSISNHTYNFAFSVLSQYADEIIDLDLSQTN